MTGDASKGAQWYSFDLSVQSHVATNPICQGFTSRGWNSKPLKSEVLGASLVAQWLRICLLMQGTWVRALVWEDPTCRGATRPVSHNY